MSGELRKSIPIEGGPIEQIDIKEALIQVQPIATELTPVATPEEQSPAGREMADKKDFSIGKPDGRARSLASSLTLEEQVSYQLSFSMVDRLGPILFNFECMVSCGIQFWPHQSAIGLPTVY